LAGNASTLLRIAMRSARGGQEAHGDLSGGFLGSQGLKMEMRIMRHQYRRARHC
jgi:hypothetical protein